MDALVYSDELAAYRLSETHPLDPYRFVGAVALMESWGLLRSEGAAVLRPAPCHREDLLLVHEETYVDFVRRASINPADARGHGIGPGDTPAFAGMHDAASTVTGATIRAVEAVLAGAARRTFSPAGGLHHAHADHASGFCVYNDCAVAIARATLDHPGLRVAYVDLDAHHGDGVQAAFYDRSDVLTISVHESGRYLFPGTGLVQEVGEGQGVGCAINVPLPPYADGASYQVVHEEVIAPALKAFSPDLIVAQLGADTHRADPLTHLYQSVQGFTEAVARIVDLAEELTSGRLVATGGGGYRPFSEVPRMWAGAFAVLLGREIPERVPDAWRHEAQAAASRAGVRQEIPKLTFTEELAELDPELRHEVLGETRSVVERVRRTSPLLRGA